MTYEQLYDQLAPSFAQLGIALRGPEESHDFLAVTDMIAFGLVANWMLRLVEAADTQAEAVLSGLGPVGQRLREQIEQNYDTWLMQVVVEQRQPTLLQEVIRLGINGTAWVQWQAEAARLRINESFLDECVQTVVKITWFELTEADQLEEYLATLSIQRLVERVQETLQRQACELGIAML
ncbi:MAG: hypothetical protein SNJ82_00790 [Gemmataceae bacterium]